MRAGYYFPMTEEQQRKIEQKQIRIAATFFAIGLFIGVVLGYAWRMAQMMQ